MPTAGEIAEFEGKKEASLQKNSNQNESDNASDLYIERLERLQAKPESGIELNIVMRESYDFWINKGLKPEWAAGIVANEWAESK